MYQYDWQVINHGVPNEVLHKMKEVTRGFFNLSLEEKNKFSTTDDIQGYGHTYVFSEEQILDWSDSLTLITVPKKFRKRQFWPTTPTEFHDTLDAYSNGVTNVAEQLIGFISLNLGLEHSTLLDDHKGLWHGFRINYYPPCSKPNEVLGISPHADTDTITVLLQDDDISALQIRHGDEWVPIKPIPNALVVNLGDVLEIWSNGKYKSIEHRAVTHESKSRISLVSFIFPSDEAEVEPYDSIVESQGSVRKYKKVNYGEFLRGSMQIKLEGKVGIETAKIY